MADNTNIAHPFQVARGLENKILGNEELKKQNGVLCFATDTKKIYLSDQDEWLSMGGNTGIYYADSDQPDEGEEFIFSINDMEDNNIPNEKDLILNTDGCFYKVMEIRSDDIIATKLTIAGSGGAGTGALGKMDFSITNIPGSFKTILAGKPFILEFNFSAVDAEGVETGNGRYEIYVNGAKKKTGVAKQGHNSIEIGDLFTIVGDYEVRIFCYGYTGGSGEVSKSKYLDIKSTLFTTSWDYNETTINSVNNDFTMRWSVSVESDNKNNTVIIDDTYTFANIENNYLTIPTETLEELGIGHGAHKFELRTSAYIGNDTEPSTADPIIKQVLFYDAENTDYIISYKFYETKLTQYDTIQIPVMIYHPDNQNGSTVIFKVNGEYKAKKDNCFNLTEYSFSYTPAESGFLQLGFACGTTEISFILEVDPLDIDVEEVEGYTFKFKASDFTNNEEIQEWTYNGQSINFYDINPASALEDGDSLENHKNFDWINGGLQTGIDDVGPYFKIQTGSYMEIPLKLFEKELWNTGASFKIIFKASNCRDYKTSIVNCCDNNGIGFYLNAQDGGIRSLNAALDAKYCEDSYIEFEFDISKYSSTDRSQQFITLWMDGIPCRVINFTDTDSFKQGTPRNLVIGSDDCDVYIYLIKYYQKSLTFAEHLSNFIIDAPNAEEIFKRFDRNDIMTTDASGNEYISPELLAEKNQNCNVYIYDIPYIPTSKADVTVDGNAECCTFTLLKGSKNAIRYDEKVKMRAQGTSSMSYGVSAFNLDTKFKEKWSLDDEAIPVNYFNTKVNVASSEGANNAINQEWYDRYQPYKTQKRLQERQDGKVARDTMEFKNGVVFLKDNNKNKDKSSSVENNVFKEITGYVDTPYPRMYSIGNMGNSKKNIDVFHGAGNIYECCVENADNNTNGQQMVTIGGFMPKDESTGVEEHEVAIIFPDGVFDDNGFVIPGVDWGKSYDDVASQVLGYDVYISNKTLWTNALINEGLFEFRYINEDLEAEDGSFLGEEFSTYNDYQEELSNRFLRLVRWFVINNPANATNQQLPNPVTFNSYLIKGVKNSAYSNYNSDDEVLANTLVAGGTYTQDTAEYRVAKMLRECENYIILDSLVYHYLFIERHTMVDNVAKNTFWNTEDGIHWEMTKDYDNDTADGIDNSGNFVFDYGIEVMDDQKDGRPVFNARSSAWLHFIHGLPTLRQEMYEHLSNLGAWNADGYLNLFNEWQNCIPEVCWIEDFYRKYFRPYVVYNEEGYLSRLANGKKTHQRKQFEIYQEPYFNSRYKIVSGMTPIQWRSAQPAEATKNEAGNYEIKGTVKMFADGYVSVAIASGAGTSEAINVHIRGKKDEIISFSKEQGTTFGDATCYLYFPNLYSELTNIESLYPTYVSATEGTKLRKISLIPTDAVQQKMLNQSLSFGNSIEEIIFKDCTEADFDLDLRGCIRLKTLNTEGSAFTGHSIADGAPVQEIKINSPTTLYLSNLKYLNEENFNIQSYDNLAKIDFNNVDINPDDINVKGIDTKNIINRIIETNEGKTDFKLQYNLENVNWVFNDTDAITDTNIPILDYLLSSNTINDKSRRLSLTGNAVIPNEAYSSIGYLDLYEKYGLYSNEDNTYSNLNLIFTDLNGDSKLSTLTILNGDDDIVWQRQYVSYSGITNDDLAQSSKGAFDATIAIKKKDSNTQIANFNNRWIYTVDSTGASGYITSANAGEYQYLDLSQLSSLSGNITIKPDYTYTTKYYNITFKDSENGNTLYIARATYDSKFEDVKPPFALVKDDSALDLDKTWQLIGYSAVQSSSTTINELFWRVSEDTTLYPVYSADPVSVYDLDYSEYLNINNGILNGLKTLADGTLMYSGKKITIPANVHTIGSAAFKSNNTLKKVFVENDSQLNIIETEAFRDTKLEYFDFNNCIGLSIIGESAFRNTYLKANDYNGIMILPESLNAIQSHAFNGNNIFADSINMVIKIPSSVTTAGAYFVAHMQLATNVQVDIGSQDNPSQLNLDGYTGEQLISSNGANTPESEKDIQIVNFYTDKYTSSSMINNRSILQVLCGSNYVNMDISIGR